MADTFAWLTDGGDPRVVAALGRECGVPTCLADIGIACKGTVGIVHQARVPADVLGVKR
ncbi:hypothetical protein C1Y40_04139 [Mycobacterium talmoniae]|uniref:Uncharacterized protein n=1 Tax=Mycobacterium talmoniae TaxID=1858794 RepID=A0A2S8BGF2_9MYCO|nr:hypothetical protein C1Y40_04139 [Mycobacterium talmoniae]